MSDEPRNGRDGQPDKPLVTTADEVVSTFMVTSAMEEKYSDWCSDSSRSHVVELVTNHTTAVLYQLTLDDVHTVCNNTEHALGYVDRSQAESVLEARDWYPTFAFTHIMHHYLEQQKEIPTWQQIRHYFFTTDEGETLIGREIREHKARIMQKGVPKELARDALQWRFGNAYYSFLRELYTVVKLRSRGLDVRVHPLADALFRVDAWTGNTVISLWVANEDFRRDKGLKAAGRKERPADLLAEAEPPFNYVDIELDKATRWGRVHLPSDAKIASAVADLSKFREQTHAPKDI